MKSSVFQIAFVIAMLLTSCGNYYTTSIDEVNVDVNMESKESSFISSAEYVMLETKETCLLKGVGFIEKAGNFYVIQSGKEVFTFNQDGKFISAFQHFGQGPQEYLGIDGMRVYGNSVYILDQDGKKILVYGLDGRFKFKIKLKYQYVDFYVVAEDKIVLASGNYNRSMHEFAWINRKGDVLKEIGKYREAHTVQLNNYTPFAGTYGNGLIVNMPFSMISYILTETALTPFYHFSFNTKDQLPSNLTYENVDINKMLDKTTNCPVVSQLGYYASKGYNQYLTFSLFGNKGGVCSHLVKFDQNGMVLAQLRLFALLKEYPYLTDIKKIIGDKILAIQSPRTLFYLDKKIGSTYWKDKGLTLESNPVICLYTLR